MGGSESRERPEPAEQAEAEATQRLKSPREAEETTEEEAERLEELRRRVEEAAETVDREDSPGSASHG